MTDHLDDHQETKPAFGQWLITRKDRSDLVGQLAVGTVADRRFPVTAILEAVREHLSVMQAEGDMFAAVDDAESDWLSACCKDAWEQALALMADRGQMGACAIVASGMRKTPPEQPEQYRRWKVLADCLNAVTDASRTKH